MTTRNKGQLRIGKSGSINIESAPQESSIKVKIRLSGPISIGNMAANKENELNKERLENIKIEDRKKEIHDSGSNKAILENIKIEDRKKEKIYDKLKKENERLKKEKAKKEEILKKKWLEIINKKIDSKEETEKVSKKDSNVETIIRFANKIDEFNISVQDNKVSGRPWHHRLEGNWWQGMSEKEARTIIESGQDLDKLQNESGQSEEIDWSQLSNIDWNEKRSILLHPFLYPFASLDAFIQNSKNFARLLAMKNKIGGFDVADSDRISKPAVDLINKIDLMIVPSNFVKDTYTSSGVTIPIEVLPHGISDIFSNDNIVNTDNEKIMRVRRLRQKGKIMILYFLVHSPHRKGADLVRRVMKRIQKNNSDVILVVRTKKCDYFSEIKSICIDSWLSDNDLVALYDSCDICLSPSRGGGFELNALEAVSRGVPTLVPNGGCFIDLMDYFIPIGLDDKVVQSLPGNTIHIGSGCQVSMDDFEDKLIDVINRLDYWREYSKRNIKDIREKYSWRNTAKMLDECLMNHGFIERKI